MRKSAFGVLDLLITLIVIVMFFMISANLLNSVSSMKVNGSSDVKSIRQHVDEQVSEIENLRNQTIEYNKNTNLE